MHLAGKQPDGPIIGVPEVMTVSQFTHLMQGFGDVVEGEVLVRPEKPCNYRSYSGVNFFGNGIIFHVNSGPRWINIQYNRSPLCRQFMSLSVLYYPEQNRVSAGFVLRARIQKYREGVFCFR
ncbi:hypothetical protein Pat9b_4795 (plasmid) [Pantoea sp. At-9b]|nr:hypothetical protein Pat9b_4795 [Pantoea sp. At-9b]